MSSLTPTRDDFLSDREAGKELRDRSPEMLHRHDGFSVWTTKERAILVARRYRLLGRKHPFVAELDVPEDVRMEPFAAGSDHLTAWGDPDAFVRAVIEVEPIHFDVTDER